MSNRNQNNLNSAAGMNHHPFVSISVLMEGHILSARWIDHMLLREAIVGNWAHGGQQSPASHPVKIKRQEDIVVLGPQSGSSA